MAPVLDANRLCAAEGLSWLWSELDQLTESDDPAVVADAWEAVERLREEVPGAAEVSAISGKAASKA